VKNRTQSTCQAAELLLATAPGRSRYLSSTASGCARCLQASAAPCATHPKDDTAAPDIDHGASGNRIVNHDIHRSAHALIGGHIGQEFTEGIEIARIVLGQGGISL